MDKVGKVGRQGSMGNMVSDHVADMGWHGAVHCVSWLGLLQIYLGEIGGAM